jgi:hypothetical protein
MSVDKKIYSILGYDLQNVRNKILTENFVDSKKYEDLTCYQSKGNIQLFTDPMSGDHLYLGFVIGEIPENYGDYVITTTIGDYEKMKKEVDTVLQEIYPNKELFWTQYITFTEYR